MRRTAMVAAVAAALALAGCGGGNGDDGGGAADGPATTGDASGPLSVAQAKEQGGTGLTIRGFIFGDQGQYALCNGLEQGSYPPICTEPALAISNPDAVANVQLAEGIGQAGGLSWSERPVSLTGDVSGDAVTVSEIVEP